MRPTPIVLSLLCGFLTSHAVAQSSPRPGHVQASLIGDVTAIVPGKPFTVAIVFKLDPTWHIYYKNPGDSGMAPSVKWTLPEGLIAGELQFPKPEVLKSPAGTNFVYENEAALLVTFTPDQNFHPGRDVEIAANLKWLECDDDACVPGKATTSLKMSVADQSSPNQAEQFDAWRVKVKEAESFDPATAK